jgi:predicted RNase H-like HicB family nuclease
MLARHAYPLTFLFAYDEEAKAWAAYACEISVASCGESLDDAREMIRDAVETTVSYEVEEGDAGRLARPAEAEYIAEFYSGEGVVTEHCTLLVSVETEPGPRVTSLEFIPLEFAPFCCHSRAAA